MSPGVCSNWTVKLMFVKNLTGNDFKFIYPKKAIHLRSVVQQEMKLLVFGSLAMMCTSAMNLSIPKVMEKLISYNFSDKNALTMAQLTAALCAWYSFGATTSYLRVVCLGTAASNIAATLRQQLYKVFLLENGKAHDGVGAVVHQLMHNTSSVADSIVSVYANGCRALNSTIGGSLMLLRISTKLTLLSVVLIPSVGVFSMLLSKSKKRYLKNYEKQVAKCSALIQERLSQLKVVQILCQQEAETECFDRHSQEALENIVAVDKAKGRLMACLSFGMNVALSTVLLYGGRLIHQNEMRYGELTSFALYAGMFGLGSASLVSSIGEVKKVKQRAKHIFAKLNQAKYPVGSIDFHRGGLMPNVEGTVEFRNVSFNYKDRQEANVLKNINFTMKQGKVVALVGPSGAGKSTIVDLILQVHRPTFGGIYIDGIPAVLINTDHLRRQIGVVHQEPMLFNMSILENIRYGNPKSTMDEVIHAAKEACAHDFIQQFPEQYDTIVGEFGGKLSGGEKQRIAIARAILRNPKILILDEATSALDTENQEMIKKAIHRAMQSRTVLIISHRLSTIEHVDERIELSDGKLVVTK